MNWLLYGFLEKEVPRDTIGQTGWLVNGWTTATGGGTIASGVTPSAITFKPILMIIN